MLDLQGFGAAGASSVARLQEEARPSRPALAAVGLCASKGFVAASTEPGDARHAERTEPPATCTTAQDTRLFLLTLAGASAATFRS
jgi:hypothetical protein